MRKLIIALAAIATAATAQAVDFHGYFREGFGINSKGGSQACFGLPVGFGYKARLGNECDLYGEWEFSQTIYKDDTGVEAKYVFMPAYGISNNTVPSEGGGTIGTTPGTAFGYGTGNLYVQQNWAGMKLPQLGGATIWAGDRYYMRENVDPYDFFYYNPHQGHPTAGIEDVNLGFGKMAFAISHYSSTNIGGAYFMPTVHFYNIPIIENGTLEFIANLAIASQNDTKPLGADPKTSPAFLLEWFQDKVAGGFNKLTVQYGFGAMRNAQAGGPDAAGTSDDKHFRAVEQFVFMPTPDVSGGLFAIYEDVSTATTATGSGFRQLSVELRPAYHVSDYFKLAVDASYQVVMLKDAPAGTSNPSLLKITAAPTLVAGRSAGIFSRPELRLFATYGKWSNLPAGSVGGGAFGTDDNGLSFGAQVEAWW